MRTIIVSDSFFQLARERLEDFADQVIALPKDSAIREAWSDHPDLHCCALLGYLVHDRHFAEHCPGEILGTRMIQGTCQPRSPYPFDVPYNVLACGKRIFLNPKTADPCILETAQRSSLEIVSVKQGYPNCSALVAGRRIISSDEGMLNAGRLHGYIPVRIDSSDIRLDSSHHGFIGGCCGRSGRTILFTGDPTVHKSGPLILESLAGEGLEHLSLMDGPMTDVGSLIVIAPQEA